MTLLWVRLGAGLLLWRPSLGSLPIRTGGTLSPEPQPLGRQSDEPKEKRNRPEMVKSRMRHFMSSETFISDYDVLNVKTPASGTRHPFWHFEAFQLRSVKVWICCVVLFTAGVLCSAGGIGGGGIYVTVLMVAGQMQVADAVPLSKSIVFLGSIPSLILNMRKSVGDGEGESLIDYNICRLVVPASLLGTFLGVYLNRHLPAWLILSVLVFALLLICFSVMQKTWRQYQEEKGDSQPASSVLAGSTFQGDGSQASSLQRSPPPSPPRGKSCLESTGLRSYVGWTDILVSISMLVIIIIFGMLRFHAGECLRASSGQAEQACNHPAYFWLGHGTLGAWMSGSGATAIRRFSFLFPLCVCVAVFCCYTAQLVTYEGWSLCECLKYSLMAVCTGCLAGLVGIGGGLIFSPFFLIMGVEPSVAVASSSTCVIFTSSSTAMQYLLTDRIIISLTCVYGTLNLLASFLGTTLVHQLQDRFAARKSYISMIVLLGVIISTVLSIVKLVRTLDTTLSRDDG